MSENERRMNTWDGIHVDNDDIKDIAEDVEYFANEVNDFLDPENELQAEGIKLDAELRYSAGVQDLVKMVMKDFDITDIEDLQRAVETIGERVVDDIESCPYYRRSRKAVERLLRFAMKNIQVTDLPTGKRMQWVNDLTRRLYDIMKSETSVEDLHEFVGDVVEDFLREVV